MWDVCRETEEKTFLVRWEWLVDMKTPFDLTISSIPISSRSKLSSIVSMALPFPRLSSLWCIAAARRRARKESIQKTEKEKKKKQAVYNHMQCKMKLIPVMIYWMKTNQRLIQPMKGWVQGNANTNHTKYMSSLWNILSMCTVHNATNVAPQTVSLTGHEGDTILLWHFCLHDDNFELQHSQHTFMYIQK